MIQKFTVLSGLVLSATCMVLHQPQIPLLLGLQYNDNPNYNFAYEVNDVHSGDIKNQHESRRGDTVLGQYSLIQPDGIRRTIDYRADDHTGFLASVNNEGQHATIETTPNLAAQSYQQWPSVAPTLNYQPTSSYQSSATYQPAPTFQPSKNYQSAPTYQPTTNYQPAPSQTPVAVSRTSFVQTISHSTPVSHNPWP